MYYFVTKKGNYLKRNSFGWHYDIKKLNKGVMNMILHPEKICSQNTYENGNVKDMIQSDKYFYYDYVILLCFRHSSKKSKTFFIKLYKLNSG